MKPLVLCPQGAAETWEISRLQRPPELPRPEHRCWDEGPHIYCGGQRDSGRLCEGLLGARCPPQGLSETPPSRGIRLGREGTVASGAPET